MMYFKQFMRLTLTELKLFWREPIALFFNFIFPVFMLFVIMEIFIPADVPKEIVINHITPALMVLIISSTAIFGIPASIVTYRQNKFLKRLRCSPVTPLAILGGFGLANFIVTLLGIALLALVAMLVYGATLTGSVITFLGGFVLVFLSLTAIFLFIPGVVRSERTAIAISQIVYFPVMFLSGVFVPLDQLPDWIAYHISPFIPVTHAVALLQGLWLDTALTNLTGETLVLLGVLLLGAITAARTFRWE
jgi:ABC-2 type transport system permease protein